MLRRSRRSSDREINNILEPQLDVEALDNLLKALP